MNKTPNDLFRHPAIVRGWRWKIAGPPLPFELALPVGEALRYRAMNVHKKRTGKDRLPDCLHGPVDERAGTGPDGQPPKGHMPKEHPPMEHPHAFWLAEDHDHDGLIDHVLVYADAGLSRTALHILLACRPFYLPGQQDNWQLVPQWMGEEVRGPLYGPSRVWRSHSPWFPARHRESAETQIRRELQQRGFPSLLKIEEQSDRLNLPGGGHISIADFACQRGKDRHPASNPPAIFARLTFAHPITGPLSLGFGAHFGLGQFVPVI